MKNRRNSRYLSGKVSHVRISHSQHFLRIMAMFALLLTLVSPIQAQVNSTGTISGRVTDAQGQVVSGASVNIVEQQTNVSTKIVTNNSGYYSAGFLKPGSYSVKVTAPGFEGALSSGMTLQVGQTLGQDFTLKVGQVTETVSVTSDAPLLNAESGELGNVISREPVVQLPLNGRNFSQLALLVPGVNSGAVGGVRATGSGNETQRAGTSITANGARGSFNLYMINGINDVDQSVGTAKVFPNLEDIQEFKVQIGNSDAQFAAGGAVVNVVTRSGGNAFHGAVFEFIRNSALDARGYFDAAKPPFQQNQFGAALGGPIVKDKLFFFTDYQGLITHTAPTAITSVPTAAMRAGNFAGFANVYDPATYVAATKSRTPFAGNQIDPSRFDPVAVKLLQILPQANIAGNANNFRYNNLQVNVQHQYDVRFDYVASPKDSMFVQYTNGRADVSFPKTPVLTGGAFNPLAFAGANRNNHAPSMQATLQETHMFSSNVVNELALGFTRFILRVSPLDTGYNTSAALGLLGANTASNTDGTGLASLSISGFSGYSASFQPEIVPQNTIQISDSLLYNVGAHAFRFGASVVHNNFGFNQLSAPSGALSFTGAYTNNGSGTGGSGFADFLLGIPVSSTKSILPQGTPYISYNEIGAFAQDTWRLTPRLTAVVGVRYDLFTSPIDRKDRQSNFIPDGGVIASVPGGTGTIALANQGGYSRGIIQTRKLNFTPRVSLAYKLGDKNVIRSAFGAYFFDEQGTGSSARLFLNYPFAQTFSTTCDGVNQCLSTSTGIPLTPSATNVPTVVYFPQRNPTPYVYQWNLTLERQVTNSLVARGSYVGSMGRHLGIALNEDVAIPGPGAVLARQPYAAYSSISAWENRGVSSYNALQLSAEQRPWHGLQYLAAYTWSRSMDEGSGGNSSSGESRINIQNPRNLSADYGLSDFDHRHRFTFSPVYQLPFGRGRQHANHTNALVDGAIGGWDLTGIVTLQSGAPFSVSMSSNASANTGTFLRPNRVCNGAKPAGQRTLAAYYDITCFVAPAQYSFGNAGRNILIGPMYQTIDAGLHKDFHIEGELGMQFRAEFFNIANTANFSFPGNSIGSAAAGKISALAPGATARQLQFALRFHW
ncbi:Carboxypeptidase regulatory-like domain-containing protein [Granulicella pectinivorans]|uniref:Carboxypeptidase regulatory-like domain-containing protein n=1 Tax=Granulicella pectinivorans TaxID=474950 RepID=A0A1I6L473_9BACT|nr:carboxypeptidase-like regulatory domain-containing protein [Granulicella pectinivorans]SFR98232.1 Carboxypeptidase regulatory-like domain-containing protein [Granulicella pectinivorans]